MGLLGYSWDEYASEVVAILRERYGMADKQASDALYETQTARYRSYGTRWPSPSALANQIAKSARVRAVPVKGPPMESGYAYKRVGREWDTVMVSQSVISQAKFQGFARIDGSEMAVWKVGRALYAQTAVGPRHPSHWRR